MANDNDSNSSSFQPSTTDDTSWANYILHLLAIGFTALFSVYTAISYPLTKDFLQQAEIANQLSLLSFCSVQAENSSWTASCATFCRTSISRQLQRSCYRLLRSNFPWWLPRRPVDCPKIGLGVGLGFGLPAAIVTTFAFVVRMGFVKLHLPAGSVTILVGLL